MKYEKINDFSKRTKKSRSTIYRFYSRNLELNGETRLKENKRYIPVEHAKYFDSEIMFDENKLLRQENQSMKNLIDCCLIDKDSLSLRLWRLKWSFFITVAYKSERNKKSCFKQMHSLYEHLLKNYGEATALRLFFTSEPFTNRTGYHNHLVLDVANKKLRQEILAEVQNYFSYDRVDVGIYDPYKAGIFYMTKEGTMTEDWDILGNNLKNDGFQYEN